MRGSRALWPDGIFYSSRCRADEGSSLQGSSQGWNKAGLLFSPNEGVGEALPWRELWLWLAGSGTAFVGALRAFKGITVCRIWCLVPLQACAAAA